MKAGRSAPAGKTRAPGRTRGAPGRWRAARWRAADMAQGTGWWLDRASTAEAAGAGIVIAGLILLATAWYWARQGVPEAMTYLVPAGLCTAGAVIACLARWRR
jgi:hypothetical protein